MILSKSQIWQLLSKYSPQMLLAWLAVYILLKAWSQGAVKKRFLAVSALTYACVFLFVTLIREEQQTQMRYQLELLWEYRNAFLLADGRIKIQNLEWVQMIRNNILLFVPLGVFLGELCSGMGRLKAFSLVMLTGILLSGIIEIIQLVFGLGLFELDDILNNGIGTMVGFFCCILTEKLGKKRGTAAR